MKKTVLTLSLLIISLFFIPNSAAATNTNSEAADLVILLGIMNGDENGDLQLERQLTRAELARILVAVSEFEDSVAKASKTSPFPDVRASHWAVEYVKIAVSQSWIPLYSNGSFMPDAPVTFEVAASAFVTLLGYSSADLSGTYPGAQITKFNALALGDGLSLQSGQLLSRSDCVQILYNLMSAQTKQGQVFGTSMACIINSNGKLDFDKTVESKQEGPFVYDGSSAFTLPFAAERFYRDGKPSLNTGAAPYDVYYYNAELKIVWLYTAKTSGLFSAAIPDRSNPTSVTVGGKNVNLSGDEAIRKLSSNGDFSLGDTVILLLDKNGAAIDVISPELLDVTYFGIVVDVSFRSADTSGGQAAFGYHVSVACTDGQSRVFILDSKAVETGYTVSAGYKNGKTVVQRLDTKALSGTVTKNKIGDLTFSSDVEIMDISKTGAYTVVYPSRLVGLTLVEEDILYFTLNDVGDISRLILNDLTGDMNEYVILTDVSEPAELDLERSASSTYEYVYEGKSNRHTLQNVIMNPAKGPSALIYRYGGLFAVRSLKELVVQEFGINTISTADGSSYTIAEDAQPYLFIDGSYNLIDMQEAFKLDKYDLKVYYDDMGYKAGSIIRILIAVPK